MRTQRQSNFIKQNFSYFAAEKGKLQLIRTTKKVDSNWTSIYKSVPELWEKLQDYKQVACGTTSFNRNVVVVDCDTMNAEQLYTELTLNFLEPSYVIENPETNHSQAGYFLTSTYHIKMIDFGKIVKTSSYDEYYSAYKRLNDKFGDKNYTGFICKNPYYKEFTSSPYTYLNSNKKYSLKEINSLLDKKNITIKKENNKTFQNTIVKKQFLSSLSTIVIDNIPTSRNCYMFHEVLRHTSTLYHQNKTIDVDTLYQYAKSINADVSRYVGKTALLEDKEVKTIAESAYRHYVSHFNPKKLKKYTDSQREMAILVKQAKQFSRIEKVKKLMKEKTQKQITEFLGVSLICIKKDYKIIKNIDLYNQLKEKSLLFLEKSKYFNNITKIKYNRLIQQLNTIVIDNIPKLPEDENLWTDDQVFAVYLLYYHYKITNDMIKRFNKRKLLNN